MTWPAVPSLSLGWEDPLEKVGSGNPLQYPCLENPMDRGAWWAPVHGVAKSQTRLRNFTFTFISNVVTVVLTFPSM